MADWVVGRGEGEEEGEEEGDAVRNAVVVANVVVGDAAVELSAAAGAHSQFEADLDVVVGIVDVEVTGWVGGSVDVDVEARNSEVHYA